MLEIDWVGAELSDESGGIAGWFAEASCIGTEDCSRGVSTNENLSIGELSS